MQLVDHSQVLILGALIGLILVFSLIWILKRIHQRRAQGRYKPISLLSLANFKAQTLKINDVELSYLTLGYGPPLLMLPGAQMTLYLWDPVLVRDLSKHFRVILINYPGINNPHFQAEPLKVASLASLFAAFIHALNLKNLTILGYSMGAWIATWMAIYHSDRIKNLILIAGDAGGLRIPPKQSALLERLAETQDKKTRYMILQSALFPDKVQNLLSAKLEALVNDLGDFARVPKTILQKEAELAKDWYAGSGCYKVLSSIDQKTLVVTGILDTLVHRQNGLVLANGIRNSQLLEYPAAGHGLIYQHPKELAAEIVKLFI